MEITYLSTTQMAAMLEISSSTLRRMVRDKKIQAYKPPGGHFRFDMDKTIQAYWKMEGEANK
ncbi:excise, DNA binding domain, excisionase family [uncultured Caudovirales phage]|jgi:excisionase family DNA binding protein|uniref:Excise, DNA binding domain, excisionase family n=1 Tax=uncultured Caudovirales phage TaxID=2100421 RepID=A0A6J5T2V5_9CAUD|nr:excise, DNA binding domain, excisionase family [uncultured Caudovirales phage]